MTDSSTRLRRRGTGLIVSATLGTLVVLALAPTSRIITARAADCATLFEEARASQDTAAVATLLTDAGRASPPCAPPQLDYMRQAATGWVVARAAERLDDDPDAAESVLTGADGSGMRLASSWRVNSLLGDISMAREAWGEAARQYGEAYRLAVEQLSPDGKAPNQKVEDLQMRLFSLANEALVLSGDLSTVISRSGEDVGVLGSRGPKPREVGIPVGFEFGKATFEPEGRDAVRRLAEFLRRAGHDSIELVGHTDPVGSAEFNKALSVQRAEAVAEAVRESFHAAGATPPTIVARGDGEECPARVSDPGRYTEDQLHALYRRVELVPDPGVAATTPRCD